jgi:hypothetical protein
LHPQDILVDDFDNVLENYPSYMPWQSISQEMKEDSSLPSELRKILNEYSPEKQNMKNVVSNEEDSNRTKYEHEILEKYLKAKWDHRVDHVLGQGKVNFKDL